MASLTWKYKGRTRKGVYFIQQSERFWEFIRKWINQKLMSWFRQKKPPNPNLARLCLTGFLNRSLNILVKHFIVDKIQWNWRLFQHGFRDILVRCTVRLFPPFNNIINDFPFVLHPLSVFLKSPCQFFSWGYEVFPIISHRLNDRVI